MSGYDQLLKAMQMGGVARKIDVNSLLFKQKFISRPLANSQKIMASPPTITTGTTQTLTTGIYYNIQVNGNPSYSVPNYHAGPVSIGGRSILGQDVTVNRATQKSNITGFYVFDFEGTSFELAFSGTATGFKVLIDGQYITNTNAQSLPASGSFYYKAVFGARTKCQVMVRGRGLSMLGVAVDATARITPAPLQGPRIAIIGDSFSGQGPDSFIDGISDITGWNNIWGFGVGGTGWVATNGGASYNFAERIGDVIAQGVFDFVWFVGSVNDDGQSPAAVDTNMRTGIAAIQAAMPSATIVISPTASKGVGAWSANKIAVMKQMSATAAALGVVFANPLEMPMQTTGTWATTLTDTAAVGATSITVYDAIAGNAAFNGTFPSGSTVEISDGANTERVKIKGITLNRTVSGDIIWALALVDATQYAHTAGVTITMVPGPYLTGKGRSGLTTGIGNCDVYSGGADGTDPTHPTPAGAFGLAVALVESLFAVIA